MPGIDLVSLISARASLSTACGRGPKNSSSAGVTQLRVKETIELHNPSSVLFRGHLCGARCRSDRLSDTGRQRAGLKALPLSMLASVQPLCSNNSVGAAHLG